MLRQGIAGLALTGTILIGLGLATTADAQPYPQKPVRVVLPFVAGSGPDLVARLLTEKMAQSTGQQFVVDNRAGANGLIALEAVAKSAPDGYTIVFADIGQFAINPSLYKKLPYDVEADFTPIALAYTTPFYVLVSGKGPYKTLAELLAAAKAKPGGVNFASAGSGSPTQLFMEQLRTAAGLEMTHIPFKGGPQIIPAILSGDVASVMLGMASVRGLVETGQLRALAVTSATRAGGFPDIPTVAEAAGLKGFNAVTWVAFAAPGKTPRDIVDKLNSEVRKALALPEVRARMAAMGFDPAAGTPEQMAQRIREDNATYSVIIKATGAQAD